MEKERTLFQTLYVIEIASQMVSDGDQDFTAMLSGCGADPSQSVPVAGKCRCLCM